MAEETETEEVETQAPEPAKAPVEDNSAELKRLKADLKKAQADLKHAKTASEPLRGNNAKLLKEKGDLEGKLKALGDYDKVVQILKAVNTVEEAQQIETGDFESVYQARHEKFLKDVHNPLEEELAETKQQLSNLRADNLQQRKSDPLNEAWLKASGKPDKLKYHINEARNACDFDDAGNLIFLDSEGNTIYGTGGSEPMTAEQYFNGILLNEPDHKIKSTGTTAKSPVGGKVKTNENPWLRSFKGPNKYQLRRDIESESPQEATRMKREANYNFKN